jgi:membrane protein implicated in regulation of membrane protease activity
MVACFLGRAKKRRSVGLATLPAHDDRRRAARGRHTVDWSPSTLWWLLAGGLVIAELLTGTFYLLMLAVGAAAAAIAAHAGLAVTPQIVAAAVVGGGATAAWHFKRASQPRSAPAEANRDVNLDIGGSVRVAEWAADGTARVSYRGAAWAVRYAGSGTPAAGDHVIVAVNGNEFAVAPTAARPT